MQDAAKPVAELSFPSVTICSPGLNMKAVEEALLEDFELWMKENGKANEGSLENRLDEFMVEKYATTAEKILETIKAMNSPPPSSEEETSNRASAVLQNLVACKTTGGESDKGSRKKRSTAGRGERSYVELLISVIRDDYLRTQNRFKRCKRDSRASIVGRRTSAFAPSAQRL